MQRASHILDRSLRKNSAEHSWHLAMYTLVLAAHAPSEVDIGRVIQMLLLHDILEIDAGDRPLHGGHSLDDQKELESSAADSASPQQRRLRLLWEKFEAAETSDALFSKSLDRFQPLIQNIATGGGTWSDQSLSKQ